MRYQNSTTEDVPHELKEGSVVAVDPSTGATKWRLPLISAPTGGMLATAGGVVFTGDGQGYVMALDARSGKVLWKFQTGGRINAPPITYSFRGKQYITVGAGDAFLTFGLPE
jgi:outer membrane protein assembly factor BamB